VSLSENGNWQELVATKLGTGRTIYYFVSVSPGTYMLDIKTKKEGKL